MRRLIATLHLLLLLHAALCTRALGREVPAARCTRARIRADLGCACYLTWRGLFESANADALLRVCREAFRPAFAHTRPMRLRRFCARYVREDGVLDRDVAQRRIVRTARICRDGMVVGDAVRRGEELLCARGARVSVRRVLGVLQRWERPS